MNDQEVSEQTTVECETCFGDEEVECEVCDGTGEFNGETCGDCLGVGQLECPECC